MSPENNELGRGKGPRVLRQEPRQQTTPTKHVLQLKEARELRAGEKEHDPGEASA